MLSHILERFLPVDIARIRCSEFLQTQRSLEAAKLETIRSGGGWRDVTHCPVCAAESADVALTKYGVDLVHCHACDVRYGRQVPANPKEIYDRPEYVLYSKEESDEHFTYRRDRFGAERVDLLEQHCGDLTYKRILDVGCGGGYFLAAAMRKSRYCYGSEYSAARRAYVEKRTGLKIFAESIDQLPEACFNIITLFDVIEHVTEPPPLMRSIDRLLAPGGHVLIFTPNFDSLSIHVLGEHSSIIDPTEHVVLYTLKALDYLGTTLAYETVHRATHGLDVASILALQQYQREPRDCFLLKYGSELQAIIDAASCGDYARVLFRKAS